MMQSRTRPSVAVGTVASVCRVGLGSVNLAAIVASGDIGCGNVSVLLGRTVRAAVVWVSGPWYDP